jgi:hypothetical protein
MVISETARRVCTTRAQQVAKPGRQIITFLLFANITLWVIDTFMSHREITQVHWMKICYSLVKPRDYPGKMDDNLLLFRSTERLHR